MFVFRRKTEYWVRISDWSSDVCSSDLEVRHNLLFNAGLSWRQTDYRGTSDQTQRIWGGNVEAEYLLNRHLSIAAMGWYKHRNSDAPEDRKSVVQGKSASVRVDLGGSRIIIKKPKQSERI